MWITISWSLISLSHTSRALFPEVFLDFSHPLNYIRSEEWTVAKRKRVDGRVLLVFLLLLFWREAPGPIGILSGYGMT